jgi:Kef-type K+ transport system membrane component KefB
MPSVTHVGASRRLGSLVLFYLLLLVAACLALWIIQRMGRNLTASEAVAVSSPLIGKSKSGVEVALHVLATLAAIIALGQTLAWAFQRLRQPAVIGEVVAGILLGPSLLGRFWPAAMEGLIPGPDADPHGLVLSSLSTIAQLGVVFYMFLVGLDLNLDKVSRRAHASVAISHASIIVPFVLGAGLALWIYPRLSTSDVPFTSFALFLGVAMSITAFPVLARILTDRRLEHTELGAIALSCAAIDDVTAWCLLAFVVGVAQAQVSGAVVVTLCSLGFITLMFLFVRPLAARVIAWAEARGADRQGTPILLVALLCAALTTQAIGIHAVFGAFLLGAVIPGDCRLAASLQDKLRDMTTIVFLPAFFAITGLNTQINLISGWESWTICGAIILVATAGKLGGSMMAARFAGVDWRTSAALGVLMNTRGLMELIMLNIGLSLGIISPKLYAMMVVMALATTMTAAPVLHRLLRPTAS